MATPKRQLVTGNVLNNILTQEIQKIEDLEDARLTYQYILGERDETGCNWTGAVLNPGSRGSPEYGAPHAHQIMEWARARYNIKT